MSPTPPSSLFHFSESPAIELFEPRPAAGGASLVWAIDDEHAANYLLPRDCPRVCFRAGAATTPDDVARFLATSGARVIAVEAAWLDRIGETVLYRYHLASDGFRLADACAGYWVSTEPVRPLRVEPVADLPAELARRGVELRPMPELWPLHDAVASSTLEFSMIRMRNARPRADVG